MHKGEVSIFAHAWDSPYEGLRWLVLGREVAALPPHLRQLERLMRTHRFPVVHLNDSPLLAAAMVSHRNGAKVVWHLRSALAGEGRDRRSRAIAAMMERWGDAAIAIDRDVAERFPIRLPLTIVHNSVEPPRLAERRRQERARAAAGPRRDRLRRLRPPPEGLAGARRGGRHPRPRGRARALRDHGRRRSPAGVLPHAARPRARGDEPADRRGVGDQGARRARRASTRTSRSCPFTAETGEIYSALDVVTFPNQGVGLGRPVLEAATYGKPVVASGSRDGAGILLPGRTGFLLDDARPERIAAALRELIAEPELRARLGSAALEHARERFDPVRNARAVEAVYDELLGLEPEPAPLPRAERVAA